MLAKEHKTKDGEAKIATGNHCRVVNFADDDDIKVMMKIQSQHQGPKTPMHCNDADAASSKENYSLQILQSGS